MKRIYSLSLAVFLACFMALLAVQAAENQTSNQVIKLDPELARMVRSGSISNGAPVTPAGMVLVNIFLTDQDGDAVSRRVRQAHQERVDSLGTEIMERRRRHFPKDKLLREAEEKLFVHYWGNFRPAADQELLRQLKLDLDRELSNINDEITAELKTAYTPGQIELSAFIQSQGGTVLNRLTAMNIITAAVPVSSIQALADHPLVLTISADHPGSPELDNQLTSLGTAAFHSDVPTIDGDPWDFASVDTGVDENHPALSSHTFVEFYSSNGSHGTGTTGMYASTDSTYRGLAFGLDTIFVDDGGADSTTMNSFNTILTYFGESADVFNYSFGNGTANDTDYSSFDRFFDGVINTYNVMVAKSCGNGGWGTTTITHPAPAYNLLASANMDDLNTVTRSDDIITSSSSTGPTLGQRRKPDITAPGNETMSPETGGGWQSMGGTSSAAPKTGSGALLLYDFGVTSSMAVRAILINTADAWTSNNTSTTTDDGPVSGDHWDIRFGWGYLDLGEAHFHGADHFIGDVTAAGSAGDYDLYAGWMFADEKSTLAWNRRVGYNGNSYPTTWYDLTNLNLLLHEEAGGGTEDSDLNTIDNVHQVSAEADGYKVIKVFCSSATIDGASSEAYALATEENWTQVSGPDLTTLTLDMPADVGFGQSFSVTATVDNTGDIQGHNIDVDLTLPAGMTLIGGDNPQALGSLAPSAAAVASWTVQAPAGPEGWYDFSAVSTSISYGIVQAGGDNASTYVGTSPTGTLAVALAALPASGTLPFSSSFTAELTNLAGTFRRAAAKINVVIGSGAVFGSWRAGWTNLDPGETWSTGWNQYFPGLTTLEGENVFTLVGEDVTTSPYNQPPYLPAGDTDTAVSTVTGIAP